jgi:hypothetical protein
LDAGKVFEGAIGPYGALFLALVVIAFMWRQLERANTTNARQQDLFDEALKLIREDLVPFIREVVRRR